MSRTASNLIVVPKISRPAPRRAARAFPPAARLWILIGAIYLLCFLAGTIWVTFSNSVLCAFLDHLTITGIAQRAADSFASVFIKNIFPQLTLLLLCCIFANSAVGIPFLLSIVIFRGLYSGAFGACVVRRYLLRGLLAQMTTLAPAGILGALALIILCAQGIRTSASVNAVVLKGKTRNTKELFERFYHTAAVALGVSVGGALSEAILLRTFGGVFVTL